MLGFSSSRSTAGSRFDLVSKSKIPPQIGRTLLKVGQQIGDLVNTLGFHGVDPDTASIDTIIRRALHGDRPPAPYPAFPSTWKSPMMGVPHREEKQAHIPCYE